MVSGRCATYGNPLAILINNISMRSIHLLPMKLSLIMFTMHERKSYVINMFFYTEILVSVFLI